MRAEQKVKDITFPDPQSDDAFEEIGDIQLLDPLQLLSDYGLHLSEPGKLHVIVQVPHGPVEEDKRKCCHNSQQFFC
jgi:hypothetical protein